MRSNAAHPDVKGGDLSVHDPDVFLDLADLFPEPHLLLTGNGDILAANRAFRSFYGPADEPVGATLTSLASASDPPVDDLVEAWAASRDMVPGRLRLRNASGDERDFDAEGCVARPADVGVAPWVLLRLREPAAAPAGEQGLSTEVKRLQAIVESLDRNDAAPPELLDQVRAARETAERASRLRDEFLSSLSHELRTPLNAILGWSLLLSDPEVREVSLERALGAIVDNAREQARMVEDMLDLSRITLGRLHLEPGDVDVCEVLREVAEVARPAAVAKRLEFTVEDSDAVVAVCDRQRIKQVVWSLVSNAVKFTPEGGKVLLRARRTDEGIELAVEDTGVGIEEAFLPFVFDRFRQADQSSTRRHGGLGLGLALARHLVELHGGTVAAESEGLGQGSRFSVWLPHGPRA